MLQTHPTNLCKMTSDGSFRNGIFESLFKYDYDFGKSEAQYSSMSNGSRKRNQELVSENLSEAKGKGTKKQRRRRASYIGESSASQQQPEPETKVELLKEFIEEKSVLDLFKIFKDRINRLIKNDKIADEEAFMFFMAAEKFHKFVPRIIDTLELIRTQWPVRSDLEGIKEKIKKIEIEYEQAAVTDEIIKGSLFEVGKDLDSLDDQRQKDTIKTNNLEAIFTSNEEVSKEALRKELYEAFPWFVSRETAIHGPSAVDQDQDQVSLPALEQLKSTFSSWEKEIYATDNNKVGYSDFQGLEEALRKTDWGQPPDYLKPIASRIEKARGKAIEDPCIQVLVCVAIYEMEDLPVENLNLGRVKKWGATLNMAKKGGFQVEFADNLLKKNFYAYCCYLANSLENQKKVSEIRGG